MTPDKMVLRLAEGHLGTGKVIQGLRSLSLETSKMTVPARLQSRTEREVGIHTRTHNESPGTEADANAPVAEVEPVHWNMSCTAVMILRAKLAHWEGRFQPLA